MNKKISTLLPLALAALAFATACSKDDKKETPKPTKETVATTKANLPNYRYVDIDTILSKYNLAKDYNEEMLRVQSNMEAEAKRHENQITAFGNSMQSKYQNNQYTEASYNADTQKMQQMQQNAQNAMGKLQQNAAKQALDAEKVVQDSIHNFIEIYNRKHHYDAILLKGATLYIDPALDITEEVVEGLNARYNKKK